ncbi:MAG: hypothetical protein PHE55_05700 [Methylococcaceae bacterium]|nr:hypothetical protein [Methylococcaceae bacterium]
MKNISFWLSQNKTFFSRIAAILLLAAQFAVQADVAGNVSTDISRLVGIVIDTKPITVIEATSMEPVCKLILINHHATGGEFWWGKLKDHPLLNKPEYSMARNAMWLHHYCWGKLAKFRYFFEKNKTLRAHFLGSWFNEMDFSIKSMLEHNPNYPYRHVFYTELAENYYFNHKYDLGITQARKAVEANAKHPKAYEILADCYMKAGDKKKALDSVNEGLKRAFPTKGLKNRYSELGGKLPYPGQNPNTSAQKEEQASPAKSTE